LVQSRGNCECLGFNRVAASPTRVPGLIRSARGARLFHQIGARILARLRTGLRRLKTRGARAAAARATRPRSPSKNSGRRSWITREKVGGCSHVGVRYSRCCRASDTESPAKRSSPSIRHERAIGRDRNQVLFARPGPSVAPDSRDRPASELTSSGDRRSGFLAGPYASLRASMRRRIVSIIRRTVRSCIAVRVAISSKVRP
jgi:hypothetical protein